MDKETIALLIQTYKQHEIKFFNTTDIITKWATADIDLRDAYLYGEIGFCLTGLKPSVLIDFPIGFLHHYITLVVHPWLQQHSQLLDNNNNWHLFPCQLSSPEIQPPQLVYFFCQLHDPRLASTALLSLCIDNKNNDSSPSIFHVTSEHTLATILDYPGHLPTCLKELETMREVIYYDEDEKRVLTTFACQLKEEEKVHQHFDQYKNKMEDVGLKLKLMMRQPL
ncbi:hypothetical protein BJ944DRAFT_274090 [Cunninghamella echinulata]|nr:hypothetical protein BJ944DRAFT_274090 [Cunninghamella echinulata]